MAKFYTTLDDTTTAFIQAQKMFFTASAPAEGRVNVSPKGMDTLRVLDQTTVAYLDLTGSGNETAAHLRENGRLTLMFCSFGDKPLILRCYGHAHTVTPRDPRWDQYAPLFPSFPGERQIIVLSIDSVQTSCGWGVPQYDFQAERPIFHHWGEDDPAFIPDYQRRKNAVSIDGLPTGLFDEEPAHA